jgi:hypothetical protein
MFCPFLFNLLSNINTMNIYGRCKETGKAIYIKDAKNGLTCGCECFECNSDLIAKNQGKVQDPHYSHAIESDCKGGFETAIHKKAKEIIFEHNRIYTPKGWMNYQKVELEKGLGYLRPDVVIVVGERKIFIEIFVNNKKKAKEIELLKFNDLLSFEIDLSNVPVTITPDELKILVLQTASRYILHWETEKEINKVEEVIIPQIISTSNKIKEAPSILEQLGSFIEKNVDALIFLCVVLIFGLAMTNKRTNRGRH